MAISSSSSSLKDEKHSFHSDGHAHNILNQEAPAHTTTETAINPDTADQPEADIEKAGTAVTESSKPSPPPAFDPSQFPDGGAKAWLCVLGSFCCMFCSFGWINCVGVFQDYYQGHQLKNYSPSTIAWISSLEIFCMFFFGPVFGKIYDNYGPRWLLLTGSFLQVFGLMMTSLCKEYYQFILAQGICSPIGASMIFYPAMSSVATWFFKKRGMAFGIIASGSSIGGVVLPIMTQRLIDEAGFGWSMRAVAFLMLLLLIVANLTVSSRLTPTPRKVVVMEFFMPFKEVVFDLVTFGCFLFFLGMFLPITFIILEAIQNGMSPYLAQYLVSILNAASIFGRTVPGFLADKIGRVNMMVIMCLFASILILALWLPATGNAPIIVFAVLYGFGSGAFVSLAPAVIAQISDVRQIGVRTGSMFAVISIAALISNPVGGALVERWNGKFTGVQIFAGIMMLAGTALILAARMRLVGIKLVAKV
ncbi:major facilitator superfamily transporter [Polychaeton citri CBS 116435]|uniref:Major facilitator superfamily transporter n=1 Tax=Polychaeton citri CBS 116435 TaxID=1314669 RepID=A0A9P4Q823_9PEZI|nr:major facilitator superfamily transporter [Polychaeton citri CBS 116435]